ncbi:MAG: DNA mismatch repair endonuclease MutL [Haliscomenobacter sp.]
MADIIQLLPDAIANQIAAGEVVQRPASVVKEMLENAVDAGSTVVRLILKDAGRTLIQVIDNGCGMSPTDARMCFERHATSKIRSSEDLFAIRTMGFRGEALASIAAVAQVELRTRLHAEELGTRIVIEDSRVKTQEPCQTAGGTSIAVKNLFYNVPARRNFLKSDAVELRNIQDEFQRVAIANPDIQFVVHHNDAELYHLTPGNLRQRITGVFGTQSNKRLVPLSEETDAAKISGFIGKPEFAKKSRGEQLFFVNNRFIRSSYLNHAVMAAYEDLLSKENFPLYVIFIQIDPSRVDVNVHPTKQEVKFEDERLVYNYIRVAVRHALGKYGIMPSLDFEQEQIFSMPDGVPGLSSVSPGLNSPSLGSTGAYQEDFRRREEVGRTGKLEFWETLYGESPGEEPKEGEANSGQIIIQSNWSTEASLDDTSESFSKIHKAPVQLQATYILSQIKSGFILVDQQAAHERILYERYLNMLQESGGVVQRLLFPKTLQLPMQDSVLLRSILSEINILGFDIQEFGGDTFVIHGLPAELEGKHDERKLLEELIEQYRNGLDFELNISKNLARSMARSASVRRGQVLSELEMQDIIDRLFACAIPYQSPFGRKSFITYTLEDLDKQFSK